MQTANAFFNHTHLILNQSWTQTKRITKLSINWIVNKFDEIRQFCQQTVWPPIQGFYANRIQPIIQNKKVLVQLSLSVGVALTIAILAPLIFDTSLLAIGMFTGCLIILAACKANNII